MTRSSNYNLAAKIATAVLLVAMFTAGYGIRMITEGPEAPHTQIRLEGYRFTQPLLECEVAHPSHNGHPDMGPFRDIIQDVVDEHVADRSVRTVALYFRDLTSSTWFGINEQVKFPLASLMKVPLMISVLKRSEQDPALLQRRIRYAGGEDLHRFQHVRPEKVLQSGRSYTVDDLVSRMIIYSDNDAALLLADTFGMSSLNDTLGSLRLPMDAGTTVAHMTVRNYTAFFRVLYNASFLNHALSERALGYLARSTFTGGIRSGLPKGLSVASKFGEYSEGVYHLGEFGIVYYPDHPYLLGVVAEGGSTDSTAHVIHEISKAIYEEMQRQHKGEKRNGLQG